MKLETLKNPVTKSENFKTKTYEIDSSPYAFQLLIKQLYKNPIQSIVRELISNAYDSHQQANNPDPIKVWFPTILKPYFIVEDFGTGLSPDKINNIYTVLFRSDRRESDKFIGGFGLGAKCPFAYSDHFLITSFYDKTEFQYAAIINAEGMPELNLINELPTTRSNGVIIKIPVNDVDHYKFSFHGKSFLSWFTNIETNITYEKPTHLINTPTFSILKQLETYNTDHIFALIQNVIYPINHSLVFTDQDYLSTYSWKGVLLLKFQIGELSIIPNREDLNYNDKTINTIKTAFYRAKEQTEIIVQDELLHCDTYEYACKKLIHLYTILNSWYWWNSKTLYHPERPNEHLSKYTDYHVKTFKAGHLEKSRRTSSINLRWRDVICLDISQEYTIYWAPEKLKYLKERIKTLPTFNSKKDTNLLVQGESIETIEKTFNDLLITPVNIIDLSKLAYTPPISKKKDTAPLRTIYNQIINPYHYSPLYYVQFKDEKTVLNNWTLSDLYVINTGLNTITNATHQIIKIPNYRKSLIKNNTWIDLESFAKNIFTAYLNENLENIQKFEILNRLSCKLLNYDYSIARHFIHQLTTHTHLRSPTIYTDFIHALNRLEIPIPKNEILEQEIKTFLLAYKPLIKEQVYDSEIITAYNFYLTHKDSINV